MKNWIDQLQPIIDEYKDGDDTPLDGDEVEDLALIIKAKLNLNEGNLTEEEADKIINKIKPPKVVILVQGGVVVDISSETPIDVRLYDYDNIKEGGIVEHYPVNVTCLAERIKKLNADVKEIKERA